MRRERPWWERKFAKAAIARRITARKTIASAIMLASTATQSSATALNASTMKVHLLYPCVKMVKVKLRSLRRSESAANLKAKPLMGLQRAQKVDSFNLWKLQAFLWCELSSPNAAQAPECFSRNSDTRTRLTWHPALHFTLNVQIACGCILEFSFLITFASTLWYTT